MSYSLLIQNRNSGKIYECASIAQTVVLSTKRTGAPASLKADLLKCGGLAFWEGDPIRFEVDGTLVFYGYVFAKEQNRWGELSVTAYDQTRYLLAKQAYRFTGATAESVGLSADGRDAGEHRVYDPVSGLRKRQELSGHHPERLAAGDGQHRQGVHVL